MVKVGRNTTPTRPNPLKTFAKVMLAALDVCLGKPVEKLGGESGRVLLNLVHEQWTFVPHVRAGVFVGGSPQVVNRLGIAPFPLEFTRSTRCRERRWSPEV